MTHDLTTLIAEAPEVYVDKMQDWIAVVHDVGLSILALHENIWDCGMTYKMLHKAAAECDKEARAHWKAQIQANWVAGQVVVVDETSKNE